MPVFDRDRKLQVTVLLAGLTCLTVVYPAVVVGQESGRPANAAAGDADEGTTADSATDPKQAYRNNQHKLVDQLRRMDQTLLTPEIIVDYQKHSRAYRAVLTNGTTTRNAKEMEILRAGLRFRILSMSDTAVQDDPLDLETSLKNYQRDIHRAGSTITNLQTRTQFRELVCRESMPLIRQLLGNNYQARSIGAEILQDLEVVPPNAQGRMTMFEEVDDVLIEILKDPQQPDGIKVRATNSIANFLQKADAIPQVQMAFAKAIAAELERPFTEAPYQIFLLAALEEVSAPRQLVSPNTALAYQAAGQLIRDRQRDIQVRCRAARVMGRAGYDNNVRFEVLAWATADLAGEAAFQFNRARDKNDRKWVFCAYYLYTAFHHWDRNEAQGRPPAMPKGFLNRDPKNATVRAAYDKAIPILSHMLFQKSNVKVSLIGALLQWVEKEKPADLKFDPSCPPLPELVKGNAADDGQPPTPANGQNGE